MIVFQLSCSIFISLVSRFRAGLKAEIGVFFPMIVLRVLENVAQPNFQQKMIVLRFLEKLCVDSQILVDIFINYDCDVNSSNIFERYVLFHPAEFAHFDTIVRNHVQEQEFQTSQQILFLNWCTSF
jgi:Sec7-like guanine-nucleotide exchange factor